MRKYGSSLDTIKSSLRRGASLRAEARRQGSYQGLAGNTAFGNAYSSKLGSFLNVMDLSSSFGSQSNEFRHGHEVNLEASPGSESKPVRKPDFVTMVGSAGVKSTTIYNETAFHGLFLGQQMSSACECNPIADSLLDFNSLTTLPFEAPVRKVSEQALPSQIFSRRDNEDLSRFEDTPVDTLEDSSIRAMSPVGSLFSVIEDGQVLEQETILETATPSLELKGLHQVDDMEPLPLSWLEDGVM